MRKFIVSILLLSVLINTSFAQSKMSIDFGDRMKNAKDEDLNFHMTFFGTYFVLMGAFLRFANYDDASNSQIIVPTFAGVFLISGYMISAAASEKFNRSKEEDEKFKKQARIQLERIKKLSRIQLKTPQLAQVDPGFMNAASYLECDECSDTKRSNLLARMITRFSAETPHSQNMEEVLGENNTEFNQGIAMNIFELKQFLN